MKLFAFRLKSVEIYRKKKEKKQGKSSFICSYFFNFVFRCYNSPGIVVIVLFLYRFVFFFLLCLLLYIHLILFCISSVSFILNYLHVCWCRFCCITNWKRETMHMLQQFYCIVSYCIWFYCIVCLFYTI